MTPALILAAAAAAAEPDTAFLRKYAETRGFLNGRPAKPKIAPDGMTVYFLRGTATSAKQALFAFDVPTRQTRELANADKLLGNAAADESPEEKARRERQRITAGGFADYHLSPDGSRILLPVAGRLFLFDVKTAAAVPLKIPGPPIDPKWSPDGKRIAYVRGFDVYVLDPATGTETAVTTGGTAMKMHGLAEFVAQEEMKRHSGYWWSPDSSRIAFAEVDHAGVEVWHVADPFKPEQPPAAQFYPRPGKKNAAVRLGIVSSAGGKPVWFEFDTKQYEYLARVVWGDAGLLAIVQDRRQQELYWQVIDPATGLGEPIHKERIDFAWLNLPDVRPSAGRPGFLAFADGPRNPAVIHRKPGGKLTALTSGDKPASIARDEPDRVVTGLVGESSAGVTFTVTADTASQHVVRGTLFDERPTFKQLTFGRGVHTAVVAPPSVKAGAMTVLTSTEADHLPKTVVLGGGDEVLGELPSVSEGPGFVPNVMFDKSPKGWIFADQYRAAIVRPRNFDPKKKYPVILDVYGGPNHLHVQHAMRNWLVPQWLADRGFIVVAIDNRGTPNRGRKWESAIYQKFGTEPLSDQTTFLVQLAKEYPELDVERVGVVGWSFGGYMAANAVLREPGIFRAAVAGAPVTDWEDYDTHYTERYMGLLPESRAAYDAASLIPLAKNLSRPLLLVHGTADDNVYYRHSLKLADALFRAGKPFDTLPLPGVTHMYSADPVVMEKLWLRVADYFTTHLGRPK